MIYNFLLILILYNFFYYTLNLFEIFNILNYDKKIYIVKNIVKSIILGYLSFATINIIPSLINNKNYNNELIKHYSTLYVGNDIFALLFVPNLPKTTKIHHTITTILLFYSLNIDYNNNKIIGRLLIIYSIFSCYSFIVNLYLGIRFFKNNNNLLDKFIDIIRITAYYIYVISCIINWIIQSIIISYNIILININLEILLYVFLLQFIVKDDLILINWLKIKYTDNIKIN